MSAISHKLETLSELKYILSQWTKDDDFLSIVNNANPWFIPRFTQNAIQAIIDQMLDPLALNIWVSAYNFDHQNSKRLGLVLAGNIPLVGFHDLLCAFMSPHYILVKISSKDYTLTHRLINLWTQLDPEFSNRIEVVEKIEHIDLLIATGSNNTYQYFSYYFQKYKHVLRKNRTSVAYVPSDIDNEDLKALLDDVFLYFGMGCRNVSKLYIQKDFELTRILELADQHYSWLFEHAKYMTNYDYQRTILLLNQTPHLANNFMILKEDVSIHSPIATLHYQIVDDETDMIRHIQPLKDELQCIVGIGNQKYGDSQMPKLTDYADGVDIMTFLSQS